MRNGSLWSEVVFEKEVIFREFDFEISDLDFWGLEIKHLKAYNFVWQGFFFLSLLSSNFDDQFSSNFHRFVILCTWWDTPSEKTGFWQLPIVSTVFKSSIAYWTWSNLNYFYIYARLSKFLWIHNKISNSVEKFEKCVDETALHLCTNAIMSSWYCYF